MVVGAITQVVLAELAAAVAAEAALVQVLLGQLIRAGVVARDRTTTVVTVAVALL